MGIQIYKYIYTWLAQACIIWTGPRFYRNLSQTTLNFDTLILFEILIHVAEPFCYHDFPEEHDIKEVLFKMFKNHTTYNILSHCSPLSPCKTCLACLFFSRLCTRDFGPLPPTFPKPEGFTAPWCLAQSGGGRDFLLGKWLEASPSLGNYYISGRHLMQVQLKISVSASGMISYDWLSCLCWLGWVLPPFVNLR